MNDFLLKIKDSFQLLENNENNWDDEGAYKINDETFMSYIGFIGECLNYSNNKIKVPTSINKCADGSIDISWGNILLINIKDKKIRYYAESNDKEIRGEYKLIYREKTVLLEFMQNFLKI